MTKCADESVPHLRELKSGCATEIMQYRTCLDAHGDQPDEAVEKACSGLMKAVWTCSERVMANIEQKGDSGAGGLPSIATAPTSNTANQGNSRRV